MSEHDSVSLQPDTWGDVDRYVEALGTEVREQRLLVLTEAFVFRDPLNGLIEHEITSMFDGVTPSGLLDVTDLAVDEGFFVHPDGPFARLDSPCEWHHHA